MMLKGFLARFAARRATPRHLGAIGDALQANRQTIGDPEGLVRTNIDFHLAIAQVSQNVFRLAAQRRSGLAGRTSPCRNPATRRRRARLCPPCRDFRGDQGRRCRGGRGSRDRASAGNYRRLMGGCGGSVKIETGLAAVAQVRLTGGKPRPAADTRIRSGPRSASLRTAWPWPMRAGSASGRTPLARRCSRAPD
ncbi:FCD domain-containing protein [Paracoccus halophilus]|uniref:FCD domain-containing protein n=1 Tax=Paracoccus halophilus TaxID=376733 RepID=A0A1I0TY86_9RHOB|nr:FCD domain-containing protein [Paracoccus halophilus]